MLSVKAHSFGCRASFPMHKNRSFKIKSCSKPQSRHGICNESFTKRLDFIEKKLIEIESYMTVHIEDGVPRCPLVIQNTHCENTKVIQDLETQLAEAYSEARRSALYAHILQLQYGSASN